MLFSRLAVCPRLLVVLGLLQAAPAMAADRVSRLLQILHTERSYKVRLPVIVALGKLKDRRAVIPLSACLGDGNPLVRGVAGAALAEIGDARGLLPIREQLRREESAAVKQQLARAEKALNERVRSAASTGRPGPSHAVRGTPRVALCLGRFDNRTGRFGAALAQLLSQAVEQTFRNYASRAGNVTWQSFPAAPSRSSSSKAGPTLSLSGTVQTLSVRPAGRGTEISCKVQVWLATVPGNSMKMFYAGETTMQVDERVGGRFDTALYRDLFASIAEEAKRQIVSALR